MSRARNRWGWGFEDAVVSAAEARAAAGGVAEMLGFGRTDVEDPVALRDVELPPPRIPVPPRLAAIFSDSDADRAGHAYGKSYVDTVRALRGVYEHVPDAVVRPRDEHEVETGLEWAAGANAAVIPYGGGARH